MAKKSVIFNEYILTEDDSGSIQIFKVLITLEVH